MSKTPFVNTTTRPCACSSRANAAASLRVVTGELDRRREAPRVVGTIDADVLGTRLHAEGVEQTMIVEGVAIEPVDRDVQFVRPLDQVELWNPEFRLRVAKDPH